MKTKRSVNLGLVAVPLGAAALCAVMAATPGCELLVDFDRSLIPQDAGGSDVTLMDSPVQNDTGTPMGDAAGEGGGDGGGDGGSDAATDSAGDAMGDAPKDVVGDAPGDAKDSGPKDSASDVEAGTPAFSIAPAGPIDFGTTMVGQETAGYPFVVTNTGTGAGVPNTSLGGTNPVEFRLSGCKTSVPAGGTCTLNVSFKPNGNGPAAATVSVDTTGTPAAVAGTGVKAGLLTISPATQSFGTVTQGQTSADTSFTVTNTDAANSVKLQLATFDGQNGADFAFDTDAGAACGATLGPSASCTLFVNFTPSTKSFEIGSLSIKGSSTTDAGIVIESASSSLTGTGQ